MGGTETSFADDGHETGAATPPPDPGALIRSKAFRRLLVFSALLGVVVSLASWGFLEWFFAAMLSGLVAAVGLFALFVAVQLFRNPARHPRTRP
jgi:hypothetical protein